MNPEVELATLLVTLGNQLNKSDERVISETSTTNATFWGYDEHDVLQINKISDVEYQFSVELKICGEQLEDKPHCGDQMTLELRGKMISKDEKWQIYVYNITKMELNY